MAWAGKGPKAMSTVLLLPQETGRLQRCSQIHETREDTPSHASRVRDLLDLLRGAHNGVTRKKKSPIPTNTGSEPVPALTT